MLINKQKFGLFSVSTAFTLIHQDVDPGNICILPFQKCTGMKKKFFLSFSIAYLNSFEKIFFQNTGNFPPILNNYSWKFVTYNRRQHIHIEFRFSVGEMHNFNFFRDYLY